ncbi:hypothetical protein EFA69_04185 [Rufibacter immobilis]|uniref:Uncharacterized protein n=1 Tax=Rufibacter immobilis TaxID=1348778 RepID=A0A3M9N3Z9_9BACT|nr:hypothetical protein [Rufibacter immobilis]RNI32524.1 hypothetical protein EFA69_04185 [Rufibacter immobilis]
MVLITGLLVFLVSGVVLLTGDKLIHSYIWYMLGFFVFMTGFAHYVSHLGVKQDVENLHVYFYASMGVRMVFSIIAIFVYRYFHEEQVMQFVFNFFALYFIYTGFEIYSLLSNLRRNSKKQI